MKSAERIAAELGVARQDIEKRLNPEFTRQFGRHMEQRDGAVYFDAEVEEFLKLLFNKNSRLREEGPLVGDVIEGVAPGEDAAREEAALANPPGQQSGQTSGQSSAQLPALHWTQLPVVRAITMPLNYRPDMLVQAVEIQRRELVEFLTQFDRLVEQMVPSQERGGNRRAAGQTPRRPIRLAGSAAR